MCHERAFTTKRFVFLLQIIFLFSLFILSCIFTPRLFYPFFSFNSILSFLLCGCCCVCVRPSMGAVLAEQQSPRMHTRSLDTHCIQLTLHTQSISTHAHTQNSHAHNPLLTDLTPTSTQTVWALLHSVSVWQICTVLNTPNYFLQVSSQSLSLRRSSLIPPTAQEAQREDDKLSIRLGSGEFSSCLHTLCETRLSRPHVGSRGAAHLASSLSWTYMSWAAFFISSLFPLCCSSSENCNSPGKRENVFLDEAARLDVIVVKGMMNWFIRRHRRLHFKWMKYKENWRHDYERHRKEKLKQWESLKKKYFVKSITCSDEQQCLLIFLVTKQSLVPHTTLS